MLSQKAIYALKTLVHLGRVYQNGPLQIAELAAKEKISKKLVEQILIDLQKHRLVQKEIGHGGGYFLAKEPWQISLGFVLRAIDGPIALIPCVSQTAYGKCQECIGEERCGIRNVMKEIREYTASILDGTSLQDVINCERRLNGITKGEMAYYETEAMYR